MAARRASLALANWNPQLGMWQATGTAIAQAPNLTELREPESGGPNISFNEYGHSARVAVQEPDGELVLAHAAGLTAPDEKDRGNKSAAAGDEDDARAGITTTVELVTTADVAPADREELKGQKTLLEKHRAERKEEWKATIVHGVTAFWKFFKTPVGFVITIYFLNTVAWGAMLFFLLLNAAPAMNHPSADDINSSRKKWLEIDGQILNGLFCVTGFGLAPWRFRDFYFVVRAAIFHDRAAMDRLTQQNKAWFRPPAWATAATSTTTTTATSAHADAEYTGKSDGEGVTAAGERSSGEDKAPLTFTGKVAPPTAMWKLAFTTSMMVINTLVQGVLCYFLWGYNRIDRPGWATGTFIGLASGAAMFAGIMSWWEGRKVKMIEGPEVKVVSAV
ncbi:hypothetical protein BX600DRAFT_64615 [Xylariales sp. PMI_506]|nr:hypothetical protein BX600DRAFT_64615 [Xylariales sp. PMI_506]